MSHMRIFLVTLFVSLVMVVGLLCVVPITYSKNIFITIEKGETLKEIARDLKDKNIIFSILLLKAYMKTLGLDKQIKTGEYLFEGRYSLIMVADKLKTGNYEIDQAKIIIPEGSTVVEIGDILQDFYPTFDKKLFVTEGQPYEGYLFPDSYEDFHTATSSEIINKLRENFDQKTADLKNESLARGKNWNEIITMASILEEEGKTREDRKIISGILYKRLSLGMALQVDATFRYINGKTTETLTLKDLTIDSPYNTYRYPGLPPTPISNPGIESIEASLNPTATSYLFFLTGSDGMMHYAKTFEEHVQNKKKYLK